MNSRSTLILLAVFFLLGGYLYFFQWPEQAHDAPDNGQLPLYGISYGEYDLVALEIDGPPGTAHFARTNETFTRDWEMLQPFILAANEVDQVRVNGAATRLAHLTAGQAITSPTNLTQYGLDNPQLTVTLTISNGNSIILYAGQQTPVNNQRYLLLNNDPTIYLIPTLAIDNLEALFVDPPVRPTPLPTITPNPTP